MFPRFCPAKIEPLNRIEPLSGDPLSGLDCNPDEPDVTDYPHDQGRWELPEGSAGGQEGGAGRAAEGVHQRVAQAARQGGGGAQAAQGEAGQEEGDQSRAGN